MTEINNDKREIKLVGHIIHGDIFIVGQGMKYEDVEKLTADEVRITIQEIRHDAYTSNGRKQYLPDYSDPREYMALMEEIWEKELTAEICMPLFHDFRVAWGKYLTCGGRGHYVCCNELWEAIARAWLVICGGE